MKRTPTDANRYGAIGATIFFTGLLAAIAGGFALYTIFDSYWVAIPFGLIWGTMIFNLDRFIVMSMRKKGRFLQDVWMAFPRLILAVLIAFVISKPLELQIFKSEIASELTLMEQEQRAEHEGVLYSRFEDREATYRQDIVSLNGELEAKKLERDRAQQDALAEADGTGGSQRRNMGPIYRAKKERADQLDQEYQTLLDKNETLIAQRREQLQNMEGDRDLANAEMKEAELGGFAAQLRALGRLAQRSDTIFYASLFITLLFIAIECAPILTKLMAERGPFEMRLDQHELAHWNQFEKTSMALRAEVAQTEKDKVQLAKYERQVILEAEKEVLTDVVRKEVDSWKQKQVTWADYMRRRPFFSK